MITATTTRSKYASELFSALFATPWLFGGLSETIGSETAQIPTCVVWPPESQTQTLWWVPDDRYDRAKSLGGRSPDNDGHPVGEARS